VQVSFTVHDGTYGKGSGYFGGDTFSLPKSSGWGSIQVHASDIVSAEVASEENVKRLAGTLGWGAAGGLVLGPVGLLAGLLLGGKKTQVTFIVAFTGNRAFIATADPKTWTAIKGAAVRFAAKNAASHYVARPEANSQPAELPPFIPEPPTSAAPIDRLEWAFTVGEWDYARQPKRGYERFVVFNARKGVRSIHVAVTPDPLTDDAYRNMVDRFDESGANDHRMIVAPSLGRLPQRDAKNDGVRLATSIDVQQVLEQR
jgi:hypothetical protein